MRVVFDEKNKVFLLHTQNTTYAIAVTEDKYVNHLYYGKKLEDTNIRYLLREDEAPFTPGVNRREKNSYLDFAPSIRKAEWEITEKVRSVSEVCPVTEQAN